MNTVELVSNNTMDLADFKAHCLEILDHLTAPGLILTKEGQPVARVTPFATVNNESLIGSLKEELQIHGDIFSTGADWHAQS